MKKLHRFLSNYTIRTQVIIGSIPLFLVLIIITMLGYRNLSKLSNLITIKNDTFILHQKITDLEHHFLELQRNVITYSYIGYTGVLQKIDKIEKEIDKTIEEISVNISQEDEFKARIERTKGHFKGYQTGFAQVVKKKNTLAELRLQINNLEESLLADIKYISQLPLPPEVSVDVYLLRSNHSLIRISRKDYFESPDNKLVRQIFETTFEQQNILARISPLPYFAEEQARMNGIKEKYDYYPAALRQIVTANRSYLYLTNVVLPGKSVEINTLTLEIEAIAEQKQTQLNAEINKKIKAVYRDTITWSSAGFFISIIFVLLIAQGISTPIQKISHTLSLLSQKKNTDMISGMDRKDEIGQMAKAAQAFRIMTDALNESEIRNKTILETAVDGLITIDSRGIVESFNPACEAIFQYKKEEVIGQNIKMLMPEPDQSQHDQYLDNYHHTGKKNIIDSSREVLAKRKNGETFPIELSVSKVALPQKNIYSGIIRDISERKKSEIKLARYAKELEHSNDELDNFAYVASHDLKAPLRVIDNASTWLQEDLEQYFDDESKENMELLRNRVSRMEKLLNDLLEYSRMGRKTESSYKESVFGQEIFDNIIALLTPPSSFMINIDPAILEKKFYRMPLQQVFYNLIGNAIKHHNKKDGIISVFLKEETESYYHFSVQDNGPGIPKKYQNKIFKMFQTLKPRDEVEGSGMGLAMVKKTIESFGSDLTIDSEEGAGACFSFKWNKAIDKEVTI